MKKKFSNLSNGQLKRLFLTGSALSGYINKDFKVKLLKDLTSEFRKKAPNQIKPNKKYRVI